MTIPDRSNRVMQKCFYEFDRFLEPTLIVLPFGAIASLSASLGGLYGGCLCGLRCMCSPFRLTIVDVCPALIYHCQSPELANELLTVKSTLTMPTSFAAVKTRGFFLR